MSKVKDLKVYYSERGNALLYAGPTPTKPILTLENYCKWYGVYKVNPDDTVEHVDPEILSEVSKKYPDALMGDHNFQPHFLYRLAQYMKVDIDKTAIDVAGARWLQEQEDMTSFFYPPK